ncbi:GspH/FimT family pseudopilin [Duganella sp.]|uniref:GspH/FimT family pseudopilin n=1 Tax=Duganella sp. TaxID=1904440 RepID=UPI0031DB3434
MSAHTRAAHAAAAAAGARTARVGAAHAVHGADDARTAHAPQAGLTLIELLVVLTLALILLGAAAPAFQQSLQRLRLQAATNDLLAAIDLTRSLAMARGSKVLMAPLDPSGANWQSGWIIFQDRNGNRRPDPDEPPLYRHEALRPDITITSRFTSGGTPTYIAYNAAGRTCRADNALTARWGTLTLAQGKLTRNVIINMLGRVRACDPDADPSHCTSAAL